MTEEEALVAAIIADPEDDTVRMAYADWLRENGREERAEYIQRSIARAHEGGKWDVWAIAHLREKGEELGLGPEWGGGWGVKPVRGFVEEVYLLWSEWAKIHEKVFWHPSFDYPCPVTTHPLKEVHCEWPKLRERWRREDGEYEFWFDGAAKRVVADYDAMVRVAQSAQGNSLALAVARRELGTKILQLNWPGLMFNLTRV